MHRHRLAPSFVLLFTLLTLLSPASVGADEPIYKYRTADGAIEYGTTVPDGATLIEQVGTVDIPVSQRLEGAIRQRATTDIERVAAELQRDPLATSVLIAGTLLFAIVSLCLFPPIFKTLELDLRDAVNMFLAILFGVLTVALIGFGLEWVWATIGWSPRSEFGTTVDVVGWIAYGLVAVYAFWRRLGVTLLTAVMFAGLWLALTSAVAIALWVFAVPALGAL